MRTGSGEDQLEQIQEELIFEIDNLIEKLIERVKDISKNREGYDLTEFAMEYLKGSL